MAKRSTSNPQVSAEALEGNLVFSKREVWANFVLPPATYEYQNEANRYKGASNINEVFSALMRNNQTKPMDGYITVASVPYDTLEWLEQWRDRVDTWGHAAPGYEDYSVEMATRVESLGFSVPQTTIGILLGRRGATNSLGEGFTEKFKSLFSNLSDSMKSITDKSLALEDPEPTRDEIAFYKQRSKEILADMRSAEPLVQEASPEHSAYLIKSSFFPSMRVPEVTSDPHESWGQGEIYSLASSRIYNGAKHLRIVQEDEFGREIEGYRSTLAFTRFPKKMVFPYQQPWIYSMHATNVDTTFYGRFTLSPSSKVQKDIIKKIKSTQDEINNATSAGGVAPIELQERFDAAKALEYQTSKNDDPWVYGRWRLVVTAPTRDELEEDVKKVITYFATQKIDITRPTGDQLDLLFESQPGDYLRLKSYMQYQALPIIGGGMPTASSAVGDSLTKTGKGWLGPYLGYTTSGMLSPVHLSPHVPISHNNPGGLLITGAPGGGKSFAAFTLTCQMAMQGVWCIYIDPKCDALPMANLAGIGHVNVFNLAQDGAEGMLDPFRLSSIPGEQNLMATEIVKLLLGNLNDAQDTALSLAVFEVSSQPNPSMNKVFRLLMENVDSPAAQALGSKMRLIKDLPYANLCFGEGGSTYLNPEDGMTIITLLGLDTPDLTTRREDYTATNRLAVTILYLVSTYTMNLMSSASKTQPKAVIIDEAWSLTSTPQGKAMIPKIARLGRSLNTALVLVSQNAGDFISGDGAENSYENSMSIRMSFKAGNEREARAVSQLLDSPNNPAVINDVLNLDNGECLIKDNRGRIARVQVDAWNQEWQRAFETNPDKAAANARELVAQ